LPGRKKEMGSQSMLKGSRLQDRKVNKDKFPSSTGENNLKKLGGQGCIIENKPIKKKGIGFGGPDSRWFHGELHFRAKEWEKES